RRKRSTCQRQRGDRRGHREPPHGSIMRRGRAGVNVRRPNHGRMWTQLESGRIHHRFEWVVAAAAVALIPVLIVQSDGHSPGWHEVADVANWAIWVIFLVEFAWILLIAPRRRDAMRAHWFEVGLLALTIPVFGAIVGGLRAIRVLRLA